MTDGRTITITNRRKERQTMENYPRCNSANWSLRDKENLKNALSVICSAQKAWGQAVDVEALCALFTMSLEKDGYSVGQTIDALVYFCEEINDGQPTLKAIREILAPPEPTPPRISDAAFVEAQKWQERYGWPAFSDAQEVIDRYREQQKREFAGHDRKVAALRVGGPGGGEFKRIGALVGQEARA
jgi:hypothetical protein